MDELGDIRSARAMRARFGHARPLERAAARGASVRVQPGAYADAGAWERTGHERRHRVLAAITAERCRVPPVFSHETAAALLGIAVLGPWPRRPVATAPRGGTLSSGAVERVHRELDPADVTSTADGLLVTTPARTVFDLACRRSPLSAVVAVSDVRRAGTSLADLAAVLDRAGRVPGVRAARIAIAASSAGSDSPLETLVVVRCRDLGFAVPAQQAPVRGTDGHEYRVDFAWDGGQILGEADGRLKYRGEPGRTAEDVLWAEKRREDALRARCRAFVRIAWEDAWHGTGLERRLLAAGVPRPARPSRELTW